MSNFSYLKHRTKHCTGTWELERAYGFDAYTCFRCFTRHPVTERTICAVEAERKRQLAMASE